MLKIATGADTKSKVIIIESRGTTGQSLFGGGFQQSVNCLICSMSCVHLQVVLKSQKLMQLLFQPQKFMIPDLSNVVV